MEADMKVVTVNQARKAMRFFNAIGFHADKNQTELLVAMFLETYHEGTTDAINHALSIISSSKKEFNDSLDKKEL